MRMRATAAAIAVTLCACAPAAPAKKHTTPPAPVDPVDALYDPDVVQDIELTIAPADVDAMNAALPERIYAPAQFVWHAADGDVVVDNVGVRYKGDSSSIPNVDLQRSYLVHMGEYVKHQQLLGLDHVALDNGCQFGAVFSQRIITDILGRRGVAAPRANFARVVVNGEYQGVYVNEERYDDHWIAAHYAPGGALFKIDYGTPGADLAYLGDDVTLYGDTFSPESKGADVADVVALLKTIGDPSADLAAVFDVDGFARLMATMVLTGAFDQYTGFNAHNYYLYRDPSTSKWSYLPHDLDVGFADNAFGNIPVIDGWDAANPLPAPPRPLVSRVLDDDGLRAVYDDEVQALLADETDPAILEPRIDALYEQAKVDLEREPWPAARLTNPEDTSWTSIVDSMKAFMERRYTTAVDEVAP